MSGTPELRGPDGRLDRPPPRSATLLTVACVAAFLFVEYYTNNRINRIQFVFSHFALSLGGLKHGEWWQLITYMFLHGGYVHLAFNCTVLYFMGRDVELLLGRTLFLFFYFAGGIVGGLAQCLAAYIPGVSDSSIVGASAGLMALFGVVSCLFWNRPLRLLILFVLPVTLTGRSMLLLLTLFDVIGALSQKGPFAHYGHLGGLYTGYFAMKFLILRRAGGRVGGLES
jgi:membrane associated rhomboid family serine protease